MDYLGIPEPELEAAGARWTAREILQQPHVWGSVAQAIGRELPQLQEFLGKLWKRKDLRIVLTGAGTSAFIGECMAPALARHSGLRVETIPTTDIVASPDCLRGPGTSMLLVSFARSGNSPESVAAVNLAEKALADCHHLIITCNPDGALTRHAQQLRSAKVVVLPDATNDRGFAMTSSFSGMLLAAALIFGLPLGSAEGVSLSADLGREMLAGGVPIAREFVRAAFTRVVYLGSNECKGLAREAALKMLELTDGRVVALAETPLGFRHGPKTVVDAHTLVVMFLSNTPYTRRYEIDLLNELRADGIAGRVVALTADGEPLPDHTDTIRVAGAAAATDLGLCFPYIVLAQTFAFLQSLALGLTPDSPSASGTVNRVVQGVSIHPWKPAGVSIFLGVDGGGTKTEFVLIRDSGEILARWREGPAYYLETGIDRLRTLLDSGVQEIAKLARLAPRDIAFAFVGLPAYGEDSGLLPQLDGAAAGALPQTPHRCGNDMLCGWAGALGGGDGINVVAGTGSIAYGEFESRAARAGGWGELFSDEGSAYWIAREGLRLFSRMSDGRESRGPLYQLIRARFDLGDDLDVCAAVYGPPAMNRSALAGLAPLVTQAAAAGDTAAARLFDLAARELAALVDAVRDRLAVPAGLRIPVTCSGGLFTAESPLLPRFRTALDLGAGRYEWVTPKLTPGVGAALYAARQAGLTLTPEAIARLARECAPADQAHSDDPS